MPIIDLLILKETSIPVNKRMIKRRELIGKLGKTLLWTTPIVSSISIPAHAQTSAALEDVTPPPPGFIFCQMDPNGTIGSLGFQIQNTGSSSLTISSISVSADIGSSQWTPDITLPLTLMPNETTTITFIPSPEFMCSSDQNPILTATYETNLGSIILTH